MLARTNSYMLLSVLSLILINAIFYKEVKLPLAFFLKNFSNTIINWNARSHWLEMNLSMWDPHFPAPFGLNMSSWIRLPPVTRGLKKWKLYGRCCPIMVDATFHKKLHSSSVERVSFLLGKKTHTQVCCTLHLAFECLRNVRAMLNCKAINRLCNDFTRLNKLHICCAYRWHTQNKGRQLKESLIGILPWQNEIQISASGRLVPVGWSIGSIRKSKQCMFSYRTLYSSKLGEYA